MTNEARLPTVLDEILCAALAIGLVLVAVLPAARAVSAIGWLPMWLVGMPAVAWWALRGFPVPRRMAPEAAPHRVGMSRAARPQARRSVRPSHRGRLAKAA